MHTHPTPSELLSRLLAHTHITTRTKTEQRARDARARRIKRTRAARHKRRVRDKTKQLIRSGKISRGPCNECGSANSHIHHNSYRMDDPGDITFLCPTCHVKRHPDAKNLLT